MIMKFTNCKCLIESVILPDESCLDHERREEVDGSSISNGSCMLSNQFNKILQTC